MTTPLLALPEISQGQSGKYVTHNEAIALIESLITRVLSRTNGGVPGSPSEGDAYIVDSATGDWTNGNIDDIAVYYSSGWHFVTPVQELSVRCLDESARLYYDGVDWTGDWAVKINLNKTLNNLEAVGVIDKAYVDTSSVDFGEVLYVAASDGALDLADASGTSTLRCMALALENDQASDSSNSGQVDILRWGRVRNDAWLWIVGGLIYVDIIVGQLTQTRPTGSGECVQVIGEAEASNIILFAPSYDVIELK